MITGFISGIAAFDAQEDHTKVFRQCISPQHCLVKPPTLFLESTAFAPKTVCLYFRAF